VSLSVIMIIVIGLFLYMGGLLYIYGINEGGAFTEVVNNGVAQKAFMLNGKDVLGDAIFPEVAVHHMPPAISVIFVIALISALFPSADGAMTALTSSFCIDIAGLKRRTDMTEEQKKKFRQRVHLMVALFFLILVMIFYWINNNSMIGIILKLAGYTYGPLLGLFAFGILTRRRPVDKLVPYVCFIAPILCFFIDKYQAAIFGNFKIGLELIIINALFTYIGLYLISKPVSKEELEQDSVH